MGRIIRHPDNILTINPPSRVTLLPNSSLKSLESRASSMLLKTETFKRRYSHMLLIVSSDSLKLFHLPRSRLAQDLIIWPNQYYHLQLYQLQQPYTRLIHPLKNLKRNFNRLQTAGPKLLSRYHRFQQVIRCCFFQLRKMIKTREEMGNLLP